MLHIYIFVVYVEIKLHFLKKMKRFVIINYKGLDFSIVILKSKDKIIQLQ